MATPKAQASKSAAPQSTELAQQQSTELAQQQSTELAQQQSTELAQQQSTELAQQQSTEAALAELKQFEEFAGAGFEGQTSEDLSIPFLAVLQGQSKILQDHPELRQGMIFNTVTNEGVDGKDGLAFIPACTQHLFVEWKPRTAGGGFVAVHQVTSPVVTAAKAQSKDFGKYSTAYDKEGKPIGNDLVETFYVYGVSLGASGEDCIQSVLGFSSTSIKKYKAWMTKARAIQIVLDGGRRIPAPLFAHKYRLKTVMEKNTKGSWYNWEVVFDGENAMAARIMPSNPLFQAAVTLKKSIEEGRAQAAHEKQAAGGGASEATPSGDPATGGSTPF